MSAITDATVGAVVEFVGGVVEKAIPVPIVSDVAGWAVKESINWLVAQAKDIKDHPQQCQELLAVLKNPKLLEYAHNLDKLTDLPTHEDYRDEYEALCDTLVEAEVLLLGNSAESRMRRFWNRVLQCGKPKPKELHAELQQFVDMDRHTDLLAALKQFNPTPVAPRINTAMRCPTLQPRRGPAHSTQQQNSAMQALPDRIFQHDALVQRIDEQLSNIRHIGIVGMGGLGKSTIASAVYERAKPRFDAAVWLKVGNDANGMLKKLKEAFTQLYPNNAPPFEYADEGLDALSHLLHSDRRKVLLVLDDVWPSSQHNVLAALNFATRPAMRVEGSRLIVTTRDRTSLSTNRCSGEEEIMLIDELEIFEPRLLESAAARQLFHSHAFGTADARLPPFVPPETCSQLIESCDGNPLALEVLGQAMRYCSTAEQWKQRLEAQRTRQTDGKSNHEDAATTICATSVDVLPPSLKKCFMHFAAFPEDEEVPEAILLHLFATHAPLHTPSSVEAARKKLAQLVQRSLVSTAVDDSVGRVYYMHDILRSVAFRLAHEDSRCWLCASEQPPRDVRYFSAFSETSDLRAPLSVPEQSRLQRLRVCMVVPAVHEGWLHTNMPRLQLLWLDGITDTTGTAPARWPMLRFLKVTNCGDFPGRRLRVEQLASLMHLEFSGCGSMESLPESITSSGQLTHLSISSCKRFAQLPEGISGCSQLLHLSLIGCERLTQLPEGISSCSELQHLNLSGCKSLAQLPEGISGWRQLLHLDLIGCERLAQLPAGICRCSQLQHLDLGDCESLAQPPVGISGFSQLQHLSLSGCKRLSQLPEGISRCSHLQHLELSEFTSLKQLPEGITNCGQLQHLDLSWWVSLTELPEGISGCSHLLYLNLSYCKRLMQLPEGISGCSQLQHLNLSGCRSLTQLPEDIIGCSQLQHLDLSKCERLAQLPEDFSGFGQLSRLELHRCKRLAQLPQGISGCSQLQHLSLIGCEILTQLPEDITGFSQLKHIDLSWCRSLAQLPEGFSCCGQLSVLSLTECENLTQLPEGISGFTQLYHMELSGCNSLARLPDGIRGCTHLYSLNLSQCTSLVQLPESIKDCSLLQHLDLSWCERLTQLPEGISSNGLKWLDLHCCKSLAQLPEGISGCSLLLQLDLSMCTGLTRLPEGISGCSQLDALDLRGCASLAQLPEGISGCVELQYLNLSGCERLARLPDGICHCSQLQNLDLSACDSLAQLPQGISGCTQLLYLDLSKCARLAQLPEELSGCSQLQHLDLRGCDCLAQLPGGIGAWTQLQSLHLGEGMRP